MADGNKHITMEDDVTKNTIVPSTTSQYYLHPSDGSQIIIYPIVLRGDNYHEWERLMHNSLCAKTKLGFLDGTITKPGKGTPEAALWVTIDSTLVGWI